jgi:penicillin-binding protein 2
MRLADEVKGASGVELGWDAELRGRNGFREYLSLEDIYGEGQGEDRLRPPEDGADVRLTLVTPVQMAAERVLARPERPESGSDELADAEGWFDEPVGAIVLMTVDGDVIAAASHALEDGDPSDPRARDIDRTLQKPAFQPPGSVFKPFVAAWALDRSGLDPLESFECAPGDDQYGEYKGLRCWRRWGHGPGIDLHAALLGSCNVYFAHLGERLSIADLRGAAQAFGFGGPTGIRGVDDRLGPLEHTVPNLFADSLRPGLRMRAANGLSVVEATPVQLARATAALATGYLPSVRIVDAIGGVPVARVAPTDLPLSEASLARVRRALVDVANAPGGTARDALSEEMLGIGLCVAVKTGSADLFARSEGQGSKHAWAAGWIPAEDPVLVFVVLCDTTDYTSSHSVVWVVRQLLREEAVRGWLAGRRVER